MRVVHALLPLVAALCATTSAAQSPGLLPLEMVELVSFDPLDREALAKEDAERAAAGQPWRFAVPRDLTLTPDTSGDWEVLPGGDLLWRVRIGAPGAHSLNLGFTEFELPEGASLVLRASDDSSRVRPFTAADNDLHGQLWTPALRTDEVVVELTLPPGTEDDYALTLGRVGQGYRGFGFKDANDVASGSCNVDVVCPEGDDWGLEIPAVGALQINGFLNCSGVMLNDTQDSLTPFFLTADHCGVSLGSAPTLVVYWNYENSFCRPPGSPASGGPGDGTLTQFTSGSTHLADYSPSDFTLVELDDDPDPAWKVSYAGWTASPADPPSVVAIHHPQVQEKRISFEFDPTSTTSYLEEAVPGDGTHIRVTDWDLGTTEGGSSGSPIFDPDHRVVGQLHGGFASCSSQTSDWYGRISVSWEGGGTPTTRLKDWLDPTGSGITAVDTISLDTLCSDAGTAEILTGTVACDGVAELRVVDCGLDLDELVIETVAVAVQSGAEPAGESVLLTETSPGSARFQGSIALSEIDAAGVLQVAPGDVVTLSYVDADDGQGGLDVLVTDTADVDCTPPSLTAVVVSDVGPTGATIQLTADEPVTAVVDYGTSCLVPDGSEASTGEAATNVAVDLSGLQDETTYLFSLVLTDAAGNTSVDDNGGACYSFTTDPALEYFTEEFLSDFDLAGHSITFTPDPGPDGYTACVERIGGLPANPAGSTTLSLSDDDSEAIPVTGNTVTLYGVAYGQLFVGSNGYITLGQSDTDYDETLGEHFDVPRVAVMYDDFNPSSAGQVGWRQSGESMIVTWADVPQFNSSDSNTFQAELFFDGRIRISWLEMGTTDGIVGLSAGTGLQPDFIEENLSGLADCGGICQADLGFGGPGSAVLELCGGDLSSGTTAQLHVTGAPAGAPAVVIASPSSSPTPIVGGTLVPFPPNQTFGFVASGSGEIVVPGVPGGGGPATLYAQCVIVDGSQPFGFAFTNAIEIQLLP